MLLLVTIAVREVRTQFPQRHNFVNGAKIAFYKNALTVLFYGILTKPNVVVEKSRTKPIDILSKYKFTFFLKQFGKQ